MMISVIPYALKCKRFSRNNRHFFNQVRISVLCTCAIRVQDEQSTIVPELTIDLILKTLSKAVLRMVIADWVCHVSNS